MASSPSSHQSGRIPVAADSPDPSNRAAHLYPVIDYLLARGHSSQYAVMQADPHAFYDDKTGLVHSVEERIDWQALMDAFEFPPSIEVEPRGGWIRDKRHALMITEGLLPTP